MLTLTWVLCSICDLCDRQRAGSAVEAAQTQHPAQRVCITEN